jgi:hypothetical protein
MQRDEQWRFIIFFSAFLPAKSWQTLHEFKHYNFGIRSQP